MTTPQGMLADLPSPETMLTYASILEKQQYVVVKGVKFPIATGEIVEVACAALRVCARQAAGAAPMKMLVDSNWLRSHSEADPDIDCEASAPAAGAGERDYDLLSRLRDYLVMNMQPSNDLAPKFIKEIDAALARQAQEPGEDKR